MKPLNELLYRRLRETFGHVRIANHGEPIQIHYHPDWVHREGRLTAEVVHNGEMYYVNCPFCTDTRKRLAICHHWSVRDERTGDDMLFLAHCHNEGCVNSREMQKKLHATVFPKGMYGRTMKIAIKPQKTPAPMPSAPIQLPPHTKLTALPEDHRAIAYLAERGFCPAEMESAWGVCYCPMNDVVAPHFAKGRIVVPVYGLKASLFDAKDATPKRVLAGWQARTLMPDPPKSVPKYLTAAGMPKSRLLYGLPQRAEVRGADRCLRGRDRRVVRGPGRRGLVRQDDFASADQVDPAVLPRAADRGLAGRGRDGRGWQGVRVDP